MASNTEKLDIFRTMKAVDSKNPQFYDKLTEDEVKQLQPFLVMRWMTGTSSARQVYFMNEFVNPYAFSLTNHKRLLWQLLTVAADGKSRRYEWIKAPGKATSSKPVSVDVIRQHYGYSTKHANDALPCLTVDDIIDMAIDLGRQPEDIQKITKEWKPKK